MGAATRKRVWKFLKTLNIDIPHDLASPLLAVDPEKIIRTRHSLGSGEVTGD